MFRCALPTVSRFFRVGQRVAMWLDGLTANPEEMDQSSKAWLDAISCLGWLGWLFPNSMHCTRFRKQSHLGASGENAKRSRRIHRDKSSKGSKGSLVWHLNTSRKSWKSSSWWGTFRTKHSTFGLFIRLGELNDDHDLEYRNKIHWWTGKICMKTHIRNSWMSGSRPPQWASHHERTCDAHHADLHIAITQCCPNQLTFVQLLASSWNETLTNGDCQFEFNWVQLGHPMPKRWWIKGPRHLSFCEVSWLRHHQQSCRLPGTWREDWRMNK